MLRIPGMPLLPGAQFRDISKQRHPRYQTLKHHQGLHMLNDRREPQLVEPNGMLIDPSCPSAPNQFSTLYGPYSTPKLPPWLAYDKQVLCFNAYFKESLQETYHASYQVRKVKIYFYLEDGTVQVTEPKIENSGIPQGCLVHRQRIPKPTHQEYGFLTIFDLNIDQNIKIFDRTYHITGCDAFTRKFLIRAGISVPESIEEPSDPTMVMRTTAAAVKKPIALKSTAPPRKYAFAQFLEYDRKVLKFEGYWDDRSEYGDVRKLEICYYLADDTIDIKEKFSQNSGRKGSIFLKRDRLPKQFTGPTQPGQQTNITLLNVLGNNIRDVRYVPDPLNMGKQELHYYTDRDLRIGAELNVFGRKVILTNCDEFTKHYYQQKYDIQEFVPIAIPERTDERHYVGKCQHILPPYNGWGSYEDSEGNCISVEPKAPQADFKKIIKYDGCILRFGAKLHSVIPENSERNFVISYYLADDTIQIYEVAHRNSGFSGGEFLKRARVLLPGQERFSSQRPAYYKVEEFYIGAMLTMKDHIFHIISADEFTLLYMEQHPDEFAVANVPSIMNRLREALQPHYKNFVRKCLPCGDFGDCTTISYDNFRSILLEFMPKSASRNHEILSICRYFSFEQQPPQTCQRETVHAAAHLELRRSLWNNIEDLVEHLMHINPTNKPYISKAQVRTTLRGCRLPFSLELVEDILNVLERNDQDEIEVRDVLNFFNIHAADVPNIAPINIAFELCPKIPFLHKGHLVNFTWFLNYLGLEEDLK